jgi:hypothetical protein
MADKLVDRDLTEADGSPQQFPYRTVAEKTRHGRHRSLVTHAPICRPWTDDENVWVAVMARSIAVERQFSHAKGAITCPK